MLLCSYVGSHFSVQLVEWSFIFVQVSQSIILLVKVKSFFLFFQFQVMLPRAIDKIKEKSAFDNALYVIIEENGLGDVMRMISQFKSIELMSQSE